MSTVNVARSATAGTSEILVCFAVKEEAGPFKKRLVERPGIRVLLTGMGLGNAERAVRDELALRRPELVLSCGFAGGLNPDLRTGTVLYSTDGTIESEKACGKSRARRGRLHCVARVVTTGPEKQKLWATTQADAVEMESQIICAVCREQGIPSAIVRVILDVATEDLPIDFNQLMNANQKLDYTKLAWALVCSPGKIAGLMQLQRQSHYAASKLAEELMQITAPTV